MLATRFIASTSVSLSAPYDTNISAGKVPIFSTAGSLVSIMLFGTALTGLYMSRLGCMNWAADLAEIIGAGRLPAFGCRNRRGGRWSCKLMATEAKYWPICSSLGRSLWLCMTTQFEDCGGWRTARRTPRCFPIAASSRLALLRQGNGHVTTTVGETAMRELSVASRH